MRSITTSFAPGIERAVSSPAASGTSGSFGAVDHERRGLDVRQRRLAAAGRQHRDNLARSALGLEAARGGARRARAIARLLLGKFAVAQNAPGPDVGLDIFLGGARAAAP